MFKTLVIAPHPDDEILGCGGTLLRRKAEGSELCWLIVTDIKEEQGWSAQRVAERQAEIAKVSDEIGFDRVVNLKLPPAQLDALPMAQVVSEFSKVFTEFSPTEVFVPHRGDVHTDHRVVFDAAAACSKWFRYPTVKRLLAYETLSETDFGLIRSESFNPNFFIDVTEYLERKLELLSIYKSELGNPPFPRSIDIVRAQAKVRGAAAGYLAAEAFELLRSCE
jgi:LmbE family N-acetylglucosaminyl deacetylase